jgi:hypothetical protein
VGRIKLQEELSRLQIQLTAERNAHAACRGKLRDARVLLRSECLAHADTEQRKEREAALLRNMYNEAAVRWVSAGSCAGSATGVLVGLGAAAAVCAALDAGGVLNVGGFFLASVVGLLVGVVTHARVYDALVEEEGE